MPAQMLIDQAGLPAGTPGLARTDGLDTGAGVTITSVGGGLTHTVRLLWVPPGDTSAVASLSGAGVLWTFQPTAAVYGSYRIELVVDEGLSTEDRQIRIFGIRTPVQGLLIPAANESADASTTLVNVGAAQIARSEQNEPFAPFLAGSAWGWWRALSELALAVEAGGGGGGIENINTFLTGTQNNPTPKIIGAIYLPTTRQLAGTSRACLQLTGGVGLSGYADLTPLGAALPVATFLTAINLGAGYYDAPIATGIGVYLPAGWYHICVAALTGGSVNGEALFLQAV
jgi:hypothetical protein